MPEILTNTRSLTIPETISNEARDIRLSTEAIKTTVESGTTLSSETLQNLHSKIEDFEQYAEAITNKFRVALKGERSGFKPQQDTNPFGVMQNILVALERLISIPITQDTSNEVGKLTMESINNLISITRSIFGPVRHYEKKIKMWYNDVLKNTFDLHFGNQEDEVKEALGIGTLP